jgi:hypothetical protein
MSFNAPIRVPFVNYNGALSSPQSHYDAYIKAREQSGLPVTQFSRRGVPNGFHHQDHTQPNGVGKPLAISHRHLAGAIRDVGTKNFNSPSLPENPVLFHHPPAAIDYRNLPSFRPDVTHAKDWAASDLTFFYKGKGASFRPHSHSTLKDFSPKKVVRGKPESLPAAGKQSGALIREMGASNPRK